MGNGRPPIKYYEGQLFNGITYVRPLETNYSGWAFFKCHCGKEFKVQAYRVKNGHSKSCGCKKGYQPKYGELRTAKTLEYTIWRKMIERCESTKERYKCHNGRGITVCQRWRNSFQNFIDDMGLRPNPQLSIERMDNNGNYEPSNCKWATKTEQQRNRSNTKYLEHNGFRCSIPEWAERLGMNIPALHARINRGHTLAQVISSRIDVRLISQRGY